jgi:outer membrane protein
VEAGMLVGLTADEYNLRKLSRRIALNLQSILLGEKPSTLPVLFTDKAQMTINMETARLIGFSPSWETMDQEKLINRDYIKEDLLALTEAVQVALSQQ